MIKSEKMADLMKRYGFRVELPCTSCECPQFGVIKMQFACMRAAARWRIERMSQDVSDAVER